MLLPLVLAAMLAAAATSTDPLTACSNAYQTIVVSPSQDDKCNAVSGFNDCIQGILAQNNSLALLDAAESYLRSAIDDNSDCQFSRLASMPPEFEMVDSNIGINIAQGRDVSFVTLSRTTASTGDIATRIAALSGNGTSVKTSLTSRASAISTAAASTLAAATSLFNTMMASSVVTPLADITSTQAAASMLSNYLTGNQSTIVAYRQTTSSLIEAEEESLLALQFNSLSDTATQRLYLQLGLNDDAADRASLSADNAFYLLSISGQIASAIKVFQAAEDARTIPESASLSTATSSVSASLSSSITTAFSTEASRANFVEGAYATANLIFRPFNSSGSMDSTPCNASFEGQTYYSYAKSKWYTCNAQFYVSYYTMGRAFGILGGTILNYVQESSLKEVTGGYAWTLCYSLVRDGTSYSTFHTKCDGKGAGLVLYQSSSGYIFGGYSEHGFSSNSVYYYSSTSFLYRFVGDTLQIANTNGYPISNAIYGNPGGGPCFGGCDFWVGADMRTATSCYSSYYTGIYGYGSTWLFQIGSTSLGVATKAEIYVHSGY